MMWNGKKKALTFSYDDGVDTDRRLAQIFDRYGMKCTFNLNGGKLVTAQTQGAPWKLNPKTPWKNPDALINRLPIEEMLKSYKNHEIAVHSYTHPHLESLSREECTKEIEQDIARLTEVFGYTPIGMAYPYGSYSDMVTEVLEEQGIRYARTTRTTHSFTLQSDLLRFHPTCHHKDAQLMTLAKQFIEAESEEPMLFYVWGHSYEFAGDDNWDIIERFCEYMADRDDIFYGTNTEVLL